MKKLALRKALSGIKNKLSDAYFNMGRILYDPNFFEFSSKDDCEKKEKACAIISKGGNAFQNAVNNTLSNKNAAGDYAPKPSTKVLLTFAEESVMYLGKNAAQIIPRLATSQSFLYAACIAGTCAFFADDTARSMLMEQVGNLTSSFQNSMTEDEELMSNTNRAEEYKLPPYNI